MNPFVKLGLDFGPLVVFFATYKFFGIFSATAALMIATTISIGITYSLTRTVPLMPLVTGILVLVFGGLTLWLNSDFFIKVKLTIIELLMGAGLLVGLAMKKSLAKDMMGAALELPDWCWRTLTWRLAGMFFFIAALNEVARNTLTTDDWVNFKVAGVPVLMFVFFAANWPWILKNEVKHQPTDGGPDEKSSKA